MPYDIKKLFSIIKYLLKQRVRLLFFKKNLNKVQWTNKLRNK